MTSVEVRSLDDGDHDAVLELAKASLGWAGDERDRAFLTWKHASNPYGASPSWGAFEGDRLIGFRTFLRWQFEGGGVVTEMVRAVDTATHPDAQGRGIFTRLTLHALERMTAAGLAAVFNTPNEQSRPGYLKMGWHDLGRPTLSVHPATPAGAVRLLSARRPAEKWSEPIKVGQPAGELGDADRAAADGRLRRRDVSGYTAWRYGFAPLHYRAVDVRGGQMVFRVRRRGPLREVAIVEWRSPRPDRRAIARITRELGDYAVGIGLAARSGFVPLPRQGPILTWRPLARPMVPALGELALDLGDLELF